MVAFSSGMRARKLVPLDDIVAATGPLAARRNSPGGPGGAVSLNGPRFVTMKPPPRGSGGSVSLMSMPSNILVCTNTSASTMPSSSAAAIDTASTPPPSATFDIHSSASPRAPAAILPTSEPLPTWSNSATSFAHA